MTKQTGWTRRQALGALAASMAGGVAPGSTQGAMAQAAAPDAPVPAAAAATATGIVFRDADGSGRPGAGNPGLAGIMVSNGRDVVLTDEQGRYRLPVAPGQSVSVIKPSGHRLPVDPVTRLERHSLVYSPDASPEGFRFAGLAAGRLAESVDFALLPQAEDSTFRALLFTDPQPETLAELGYVRDDVVSQAAALAALPGPAAAFGITHGDLMFDDLSFYNHYNRIVASTGIPFRSVPGNHDINVEAADDTHSRDTFKRVFGARHGAMQYGGATFILLDNVEYLGADPAKPGQLAKYRGHFGAEQLDFVRNVLAHVAPESLVVFSFHIPLRTVMGSEPNTATVDGRDFLAAISTHRNTVSFCGHTHTNEHHYLGAADGYAAGTEHHHHVLAAASGSWWSGPFDERGIPVALQSDGCPNGFHLLDVTGSGYTTQLMPTHGPARAMLRIMLDSQVHGGGPEVLRDYHAGALQRGPVGVDALGGTRLVVNLFDGGPRSQVGFRVGGGPLLPMRRVERTDPFVVEVFARNEATKKPWVNAGPSSHIWQATLPADLPPGLHRVTVMAQDEHGRPQEGVMLLEVTSG